MKYHRPSGAPWRCGLALSLGLLALAVSAQPAFRILDLGTLGGRASRANAVNEDGAVVGEAETTSGELHAFLWTTNGGMKDLGALGGRISRAHGLNDRDEVVGEVETTNGVTVAFRWDEAAGMTNLPLAEGLLGASAHSINHFGLVAGAGESDRGSRAVLWELGEMTELETNGAAFSSARAINDEGVVVGQVSASPTDTFASVAFSLAPGADADLRILRGAGEGGSSSAQAVNRKGAAVGFAEIAEGRIHAMRFDAAAGTGIDLDTMNNAYSSANGLNDKGDVVGVFFNGAGDNDRAFLWRAGEMHDLNDLAEAEPDWLLAEARGINNRGEIAGYGIRNGQERAFLLQPLAAQPAAALSVELTQPTNGLALVEPASIELAATAMAAAGVKRVTFQANGEPIETDTEAPFAWTWRHVPAGDYDLVALVTDQRGLQRKSRRVRVRVALPNHEPEAWMVEPRVGGKQEPGATNELSAAAQDPDGSIEWIRVFANDELLVTSNRTEFVSIQWCAPTGGEVRLRAEAADDRGTVVTSPVVRLEWK